LNMDNPAELCSRIEDEYRALLGTVPGVVYTLDEQGCFTYLSDTVETFLGYSNNELVGTHFSVILSPADIPEVSRQYVLPRFSGIPTGSDRAPKLFDERRAYPRRTSELKMRVRSKPQNNSEEQYCRCKVNSSGRYKIDDGNGVQFCGTVGIIFDITSEDASSFDLDSKKKYNTLDLLSQALAHAFSNVFTGIYGNLQLIEMQAGEDNRFSGNIDAIKNSVEKAVTLIKQLSKTISDAGKDSRCLYNLIEEVGGEILSGSSLQFECTHHERVWEIEPDPDYIRHILRSLFFYLRYNTTMSGVLKIRISNIEEKLGKLPRFDCEYLKVAIELPASWNNGSHEYPMSGCNEVLEKITTMALSYSLLKKVGAAMEVLGFSGNASVTLYIPAMRYSE